MKKNILILLLMKIAFGVMPLQSAEMGFGTIEGFFDNLPEGLGLGLESEDFIKRLEGKLDELESLDSEPTVLVNGPAEMAAESSASKFKCDDCGKGFAQNCNLTRHKRIHTGERPFACVTCRKKFTLNGNLKRHLRTHTGERHFECVACGKGFTQNCNLRTHMRTHTGETPFVCPHCDTRFALNGDLKRHMRVHTKEKPFACGACGKGFADRSNLKRHVRTQHAESQASQVDEDNDDDCDDK